MTAASTVPVSAKIISLSEERASIRRRSLQRSSLEVGEQAFARAGAYDEDSAYPTADVAALHESGLQTTAANGARGQTARSQHVRMEHATARFYFVRESSRRELRGDAA